MKEPTIKKHDKKKRGNRRTYKEMTTEKAVLNVDSNIGTTSISSTSSLFVKSSLTQSPQEPGYKFNACYASPYPAEKTPQRKRREPTKKLRDPKNVAKNVAVTTLTTEKKSTNNFSSFFNTNYDNTTTAIPTNSININTSSSPSTSTNVENNTQLTAGNNQLSNANKEMIEFIKKYSLSGSSDSTFKQLLLPYCIKQYNLEVERKDSTMEMQKIVENNCPDGKTLGRWSTIEGYNNSSIDTEILHKLQL